MAKQFKTLLKDMPKERLQLIEAEKQVLLHEVDLQGLRQAVQLTQKQLADTLEINQAAISKMENQPDMFVSTLRRFLEAMGATLKIVAEFPDSPPIIINQFEDLNADSDEPVELVAAVQ
ncbi:MAG: XRE family transcriptional regulator [Fidelibacterota bacterium]